MLFRFPLGTDGRAVKRVVAVAGGEVAIRARSVTVDGRRIPVAGAPSEAAARTRTETVPDRHVFLLGDNAAVSIDSRSFGAVPESEVVARVLFVIRTPGRLWWEGAAIIGLIGGALLAARRRHHVPRP